jgi:hypothetical protein
MTRVRGTASLLALGAALVLAGTGAALARLWRGRTPVASVARPQVPACFPAPASGRRGLAWIGNPVWVSQASA